MWEFFNNFGDYFNIPSFKLEELHASLTFGSDSQPLFPHEKKANEEEEQDWEEYITNKTVAEQGFGLINSLNMAIVSCFFKEVRDQHEESGDRNEAKDSSNHSDDALLQAVIKYFEKGCASEATHWPEFIRIILKSKRYSFAPLSRAIESLCDDKLAGC